MLPFPISPSLSLPLLDLPVRFHTVHDVVETLDSTTFTSNEVMFLLEMTYFQQSDVKVHKKVWVNVEEMFDKVPGDGDIPMDEIHKKNIKIFKV